LVVALLDVAVVVLKTQVRDPVVVVGFVDIQESVSSLDIVEITLNKCRVFAQIIIFSDAVE
jgi:hypothetical protein